MTGIHGSDILHADVNNTVHLGSLRALTHQSGSVIGKEDYYPYGEKLASTSNPGNYTCNGKEYMDDWGFDLYWYGARYMDPTTGRFITPDPVKDYLNQYSYVGNNPVNRVTQWGWQ
jgi:RHS repeat-associated protein